VVLLSNDPPVERALVMRACRQRKVPTVIWLQDLYALGLSIIFRKRFGPVGVVPSIGVDQLERLGLRYAAAVVVIGDEFVPAARQRIPLGTPVHTIENWAPIDRIVPERKDNPVARALGLQHDFVFLYTGTLGLKHDTDLLSALAQLAESMPRTQLVVCSEGEAAEHLAARFTAERWTRSRVLGFQPIERLSEILGAADVVCAIIDEDAARHAVPSKVATYHAAGRAVLAAIPSANSAARAITRAASGIVVPPSDVGAWLDGAVVLRGDAALRSEYATNARAFAEREYRIEPIAERFRTILATAAQCRSGRVSQLHEVRTHA
jgi:glycosyltransferase involved in cell wall biosynthesis